MDIVNAASSRAAYYDRGATAFTVGYDGSGISPHGQTLRDTYTVPANRKTIVNGVVGEIARRAASTGTAISKTWVEYTPFGGAADRIFFIGNSGNGVGEAGRNNVSPDFVMYPGDIIDVYSQDSKTGGTAEYNLNVMLTEFDF